MDDLRAVLQESWSKAVVAASSVEQQAEQVLAKLSAKVGQGAIAPEQARKLASEIAERLSAQRKELKAQVDAAVSRAFDQARVPTRAALRELARYLEDLPAEQRAAVVLKEIEELTSNEVAEVMGSSVGAVEQRLVRARATLRRRTEGD